MCRINPRVDFAFKKLFGSEENKDLLLALINAILAEREHIEEIELKNPYNLADYQAGKISILDIKARDDKGRWLNIEMQIGQDLNFDKRAIYYWSKLVTEQLTEGRLFRQLNKTISINILGFNFVPGDEAFHNIYKIINIRTGKDDNRHDLFELHYIELKKFRKSYQEISNALDRWITFLTRAHELDKKHIPEQLASDQSIVKAIESVDRMFNEEERTIYEVRMEAIADVESKIASALEEGQAKGKADDLKRLIKRRFGQLPEWVATCIEGAQVEQLNTWLDGIFDAESVEDLIGPKTF
jgi:predicted transposase/invertase (TIGR01784 family)